MSVCVLNITHTTMASAKPINYSYKQKVKLQAIMNKHSITMT